jgi:hypothetical protein
MHMSVVSWVSVVLWVFSVLFVMFTSASVKVNDKPVENPILRLIIVIPVFLILNIIFLTVSFVALAPLIENFAPHLLSF